MSGKSEYRFMNALRCLLGKGPIPDTRGDGEDDQSTEPPRQLEPAGSTTDIFLDLQEVFPR
jgi:hypothetical protein